MYQNWNSDTETTIKNYVIGNTCYRNENYIPFVFVGSITDGNGIILDDARNTQNNSTQGTYLAKTYIANNLVFDNGGRGIHVFLSDNVIVANNTCHQNCQSSSVQDGELTASAADNVKFVNNIASPSTGISPVNASNETNNLVVENNLWTTNSDLAFPLGTNTVTASADFILPSIDIEMADFRLKESSLAINAGTENDAPTRDKDGNNRWQQTDIGCYEYQPQTVLSLENNLERELESTLLVYPNPVKDKFTIEIKNNISQLLEICVFDALGVEIKGLSETIHHNKIEIDSRELVAGIYFLKLNDKEGNSFIVKLIKVY